jgi:hypothetical protein
MHRALGTFGMGGVVYGTGPDPGGGPYTYYFGARAASAAHNAP